MLAAAGQNHWPRTVSQFFISGQFKVAAYKLEAGELDPRRKELLDALGEWPEPTPTTGVVGLRSVH